MRNEDAPSTLTCDLINTSETTHKKAEAKFGLSVEDVQDLLTKPKTLSQIAEVVQELMASAECVIWKPSRTIEKVADGTFQGRLYPYSSTFTKGTNAQHAGIPMDLVHDTTGRFYVSEQRYAFENNFPKTDTESPSREFIAQSKLTRVCAARFVMNDKHDSGNKNSDIMYAVSVYRRNDQLEFNQTEAERLWQITWFLPSLYRHMVDSELKDAIVRVNELLRPKCLSIEEARKQLKQLCPQLATSFHCHEISIYLREPHSSEDKYNLFATTLDENQMNVTHSSDKKGGLTNYVVATRKMIWFHDLQNFNDSRRYELIKRWYPEICWADGARLGKESRKVLNLPQSGPNPPLSFVASPILVVDDASNKEEVLGIIRACLGTNPFYFINEELEVFGIIAKEIGRWWKSIGHGLEQGKRADVWGALDRTLREQHEVFRHIEGGFDVSNELVKETIGSLARECFGMAAFRQGHDRNQLRLIAFAANKPDNSALNLYETIIPFKEELNLPQEMDPGFHIIKKERSLLEIKKSGSIEECKLFSEMKLVLSLIVTIGKELYGILDVGFLEERDFRLEEARTWQFLELAACQLVLFERIRTSVQAVRKTQANELRTYATVTHQLKTPLLTANTRLGDMVTSLGGPNNPEIITLAQVAGMIRKAHSVSNTIEMLGRLLKNDPVRITITPVPADILRKLTLEIVLNHRLLAPDQMKLNFILEPPQTWGQTLVYWNKICAENSFDAVIGNAFKYSNPGELIQIFGLQEKEFFNVRIVSRGITLLAEDVQHCTKYEWRSGEAKKQEGAGLGLWITENYMLLQQGQLRIHPTNLSGETMFELLFPTKKISTQPK